MESLADLLLWLCRVPSVIGHEERLCTEVATRVAHSRLAAPVRRHGNSIVVPVTRGTGGPKIALAGHLDVVDTVHDAPPRVEGEKLFGAGAADMKSGLALMIALLERGVFAATRADVTLVFYAREEGPFVENELGPVLANEPELAAQELAICLEPSDNRLQLGCNGSLHARVTFRGRTAHSSRPWQGENAIHKAAPFLARLAALAPVEYRDGDLSYRSVTSATVAEGGRGRNIVPDEFRLNVNHRFTPDTSLEQAEARVRELVAGDAGIEIVDRSPSAPTFRSHPLVQKLAAAGVVAVEPKQAWTDVARFASIGVPAVNFGPGTNAQAHQRNEHTHIPDLDVGYAITERFLRSLLARRGGTRRPPRPASRLGAPPHAGRFAPRNV